MGKIKVTVGMTTKEYEQGITYGEVATDFAKEYQYDIILAKKEGKLIELSKAIHEDCEIEFLTTATSSGHKTYERGVILLMLKAFFDVADSQKLRNVFVKHSLGDSVYCEADGVEVTESLLAEVENRMKAIVEADLPKAF